MDTVAKIFSLPDAADPGHRQCRGSAISATRHVCSYVARGSLNRIVHHNCTTSPAVVAALALAAVSRIRATDVEQVRRWARSVEQ